MNNLKLHNTKTTFFFLLCFSILQRLISLISNGHFEDPLRAIHIHCCHFGATKVKTMDIVLSEIVDPMNIKNNWQSLMLHFIKYWPTFEEPWRAFLIHCRYFVAFRVEII